MSQNYRLFGAEMSPYSVKVRSYCRYKNVPHQWIPRNAAVMKEYQQYAKLPIIPLLVCPEEEGMQDSTPILQTLDKRFPEPCTHPDEPVAAFISLLLEEFADEWGNKWMFHYRWAREVDQLCSAGRLAAMMAYPAEGEALLPVAKQIREHMCGRGWFVGSSDQNAPAIEQGFVRALDQLELHFSNRPYLMGGRPSFADFALWGQLYCAWTDPTPGAIMEGRAPRVLDWVHRMLNPEMLGEFEPWIDLAPTLLPFISDHVGQWFAPWTMANAQCLMDGNDAFSVKLAGHNWTQKPQRYHAKSLQMLRGIHEALDDNTKFAVDAIMRDTGCDILFT